MSATPRTSIIMPVYNTASTVIAAINPKNQGLSAMRNQGLDEARGEWVTFPDSDDALYPTFLERLHYHAERTGAQVVNCAHNMVSTDGSTTQRLKGTPGTLTGQEAAFALLKDELSPYAWDKIIRRELFEGVRYPQIERAEDECALLDCYLRAQSVTVIDEPLYAYAVSAGSLTWSRITPLDETRRLLEYFEKSLQRTSTYHLPAGQEALTIARVIAYLNNAQQALIVGGESAPAVLALRIRPVFGAAGLLLKTSTPLYRLLYGAYVKRVYNL